MPKFVKQVLAEMPADIQDFECDAVIVIAVRKRPDGNWQPNVVSNADGFTPKDLAMMCAMAAEDIYKRGVLQVEGEA